MTTLQWELLAVYFAGGLVILLQGGSRSKAELSNKALLWAMALWPVYLVITAFHAVAKPFTGAVLRVALGKPKVGEVPPLAWLGWRIIVIDTRGGTTHSCACTTQKGQEVVRMIRRLASYTVQERD